MNYSRCSLARGFVVVFATAGFAQTPAPMSAPAPAAAAPAATATSILRAGTPVPLKMAEPLTTDGKHLRVGQRFQLEVATNVVVDGHVVVPLGSPATGEVTDVRNKGMWGKSGHINARVLFVRANGREIRMTGQLDDKGVTGTAGVVGSVLLVPVVGFFVTGTSAKIPLGAPVNGFVDEDVTLQFAPDPVAPMVVPAAAAATSAALPG